VVLAVSARCLPIGCGCRETGGLVEIRLPTAPMEHFVRDLETKIGWIEARISDLETSLTFEDDGHLAVEKVDDMSSSRSLIPLGSGALVPDSSLMLGDSETSLLELPKLIGAVVPTAGLQGRAGYALVPSSNGNSSSSSSGKVLPLSGTPGRFAGGHSTSEVITASLRAHHSAIQRVAGGSVGLLAERLEEAKQHFVSRWRVRQRELLRRGGASGAELDAQLRAVIEQDPFVARRVAQKAERSVQLDEERRVIGGEETGVIETDRMAGMVVQGAPATANPYAQAAPANPFATAGNPFAPATTAAPANPFATAGNPFAPATTAAPANPFATAGNPFAPATTAAPANPFAAATTGANPFATAATTNPFAVR
jgi:hypothetical protein